MSFMTELTAALALICVVYWWVKHVANVRNKLKWCKKRPGLPVVGNAIEFAKGSTEYLNTLTRMVNDTGPDRIAYIEFVYRPIIVATDYKFIEFVLGSNSLKLLDKSEDYRFLYNWLNTGLLTSGGVKWKSRRRILTPAFHFQILEQFVEVFETNGNVMIEKLEKECGKDSVDIYPYVTLCTLDIICETAMGVSINAQNYKDSEYVRSVKEMCRIIVSRTFSPIEMFDLLYPFTKNYQIEKKSINILHSHTNNVIEQRKKELVNSKTNIEQKDDDIGLKKKKAFLDLLLEASVDGKPLSKEDIREEVDTFMFEGHDTTASAISFALFLLANNPEVQKQVLEEQNLIFTEKRTVTYRDLQEMKYLDNVIKEALRLYPSVPFFARCVSDDLEYENGKIIPKNTTVVIYAYGANRDKAYFKDPEKFDPSRFDHMDGTSPYSYVPFSAGPRNCIGQKFAVLEMKSTISKVIRNYELSTSIPEHKVVLAAETVLKSANGIKLRLNKRK